MKTGLPKYRCHKEVQAVKIIDIVPNVHAPCEYVYALGHSCGRYPPDCMHTSTSDKLIPPEARHDYIAKNMGDITIAAFIQHDHSNVPQIPVTYDFMQKHNPTAGGYYVLYSDGYESFSPAAAFEDGYTEITS